LLNDCGGSGGADFDGATDDGAADDGGGGADFDGGGGGGGGGGAAADIDELLELFKLDFIVSIALDSAFQKFLYSWILPVSLIPRVVIIFLRLSLKSISLLPVLGV